MKWVEHLVLLILVLLSLIIQSTLLAVLVPSGIIPDLILILVVSMALIRGSDYGAIFGFCAGLLLDMISSGLLGFHALTKFIIGGVFGLFEDKIFKENLFLPLLSVFIGFWAQEVLWVFLTVSFRQVEISLLGLLWGKGLWGSVFSALSAPLIYFYLHQWQKVNSRYTRKNKRL